MTRKRTLRRRIAELEADVTRLRLPVRSFITGTIELGDTGGGSSAISFPIDPTSGRGPVINLPAIGYKVTYEPVPAPFGRIVDPRDPA